MPADLSLVLTYGAIFLSKASFQSSRVGLTPKCVFVLVVTKGIVTLKHLEIDQSRYLSDVLERFGMSNTTSHNTPLPAGADEHLVKFDGEASASEIKHFQSLIGSLLYLQIGTCPNISFAVSCLAQYSANPSPKHLRLAVYVLSYLV